MIDIVIIDYGASNLRSVERAFVSLNARVSVSNQIKDLRKANALVLPGVGAFAEGIRRLEESGLGKEIIEQVKTYKKPYLGICLGMQFMAQMSEEHGLHSGFGWIDAHVKKIVPESSNFRIPHMGWNNISIKQSSPIFNNVVDNTCFYFVHSYALEYKKEIEDKITATCYHGVPVVAAVQIDNAFGVQFHPEKSQRAGLQIIENFINFCAQC